MKIDSYTKIILTIIACALVTLVFQQAFHINSAVAAQAVQKVAICNKTGSDCVDIIDIGYGPSLRTVN